MSDVIENRNRIRNASMNYEDMRLFIDKVKAGYTVRPDEVRKVAEFLDRADAEVRKLTR